METKETTEDQTRREAAASAMEQMREWEAKLGDKVSVTRRTKPTTQADIDRSWE